MSNTHEMSSAEQLSDEAFAIIRRRRAELKDKTIEEIRAILKREIGRTQDKRHQILGKSGIR